LEIDNIYNVINHIKRTEKDKSKEKLFALFIDLKVASDNMDKEKLWEIMKNKEVL